MKTWNFRRVLLNKCQEEFNQRMQNKEAEETNEEVEKKQKRRIGSILECF